MNVLEIKKLNKYFGRKHVLRDLSFCLRQGECCTIFGPNGAGKSTLIKTLCGIEQMSSGNIKILSYDLKQNRYNAVRSIGVVPQDFNLNILLDPKQTLKLSSMYLGDSYRKASYKADHMLELMDLQSYKNEKVDNLSGGRKRALMLGKALIGPPKLLILDEPTSGIDITIKARIFDHLRQLKNQGLSILLVTHIIDEIEKICDTIAVLKDGKINLHMPLAEINSAFAIRKYLIKVDNTNKTLLHDIKKLPNCNVFDSNVIEVCLTNGNDSISSIIDHITNSGLKVLDIDKIGSSLEQFAIEQQK